MRHALAPLTIIGVGSLLLLWLLCSGPSPGGPAPAHAAVLASVESTAPASAATIKLALRQYRAAVRARAEWARAKRCLSEPARLRVAERPARAASAAVWLQHAHRWSAQRRDFDRRTAKLVVRMTAPGGSSSGTRWIPLAKWAGWPSYALTNLAQLIQNESSGRPRAVSPTNDHGLVQFNACWAGTFGRLMKCSFFPHIYDPLLNLRFALYVFHVVQGDSFLPAWRGDPAAQW